MPGGIPPGGDAVIQISPHVVNAGYRFIRAVGKQARGKCWQKEGGSNYAHDDVGFQFWLKRNRNYGVLCDHERIVLEVDTPEMVSHMKSFLPETHRVISGSQRGMHFYFTTDTPIGNIMLTVDGQNVGHVKAIGGMVIGAGSIHPETGLQYWIENDVPIAFLTGEALFDVITPFLPEKITTVQDLAPTERHELTKAYHHDDSDPWYRRLTLSDVGAYPQNARRSGDEIFGEHPIHGATSPRPGKVSVNFWINEGKNTWHCFACSRGKTTWGTGGGPLEFFAVSEGLIDCEDCLPNDSPLKDPKLFRRVIQRLKARGLNRRFYR